jgi:GNAT superfamily N-acetyltransferase
MNLQDQGHAIRTASRQDAAEIARLLTILGHQTSTSDIENRWPDWIADDNTCFAAEKSDGSLAGIVTVHSMVVLHRPRPIGRITALVVEEAQREKGSGLALVKFAELFLAEAGCGMLEITSHARLKEAHAFYEHIGYERTSMRFAKLLSARPG